MHPNVKNAKNGNNAKQLILVKKIQIIIIK